MGSGGPEEQAIVHYNLDCAVAAKPFRLLESVTSNLRHARVVRSGGEEGGEGRYVIKITTE